MYDYKYIIKENLYHNYYPEIYKVINPMVAKICYNKKFLGPLQLSEIERLTDEIYMAVQESNCSDEKTNVSKGEDKFLYDLIKILIINELKQENINPYQFGCY